MKHLGMTILLWLLMTTSGLSNPVVVRLQGLYNSLQPGEAIEIDEGTRCPRKPRLSLDYPVTISVRLGEWPNDEKVTISLQDYHAGWYPGEKLVLYTAYPVGLAGHQNCQYFEPSDVRGHWYFPPGEFQPQDENYIAW